MESNFACEWVAAILKSLQAKGLITRSEEERIAKDISDKIFI